MQVVCSEYDRELKLDTKLKNEGSLIVSLAPFIGELQIPLTLHLKAEGQRAICHYLDPLTGQCLVPRYLTELKHIPQKTSILIVEEEEGFLFLFTLSYKDLYSSLSYHKGKGLCLTVLSGSSREANNVRSSLLCVRGSDIHDTVARGMEQVLSLTGGLGKKRIDKAPLPEWMDKMGWSSHLSYGNNVTHQKVLESIKSLKSMGIPIGYVIIDAGWQDTFCSTKFFQPLLQSFDADTSRFPLGVRGIVEDLKALGVEHVGVWHGIMGYKGGVHPSLARKYKFPPDNQGRNFLGYDLGRTFEFFHDYYSHLREQGVDFVRVGDQGSVSSFSRPGMNITKLHQNLQSAIQAAAGIHFGGVQLNAECSRVENLIYWSSSRIARVSRDPEVSDCKNPYSFIRDNFTAGFWMHHLVDPDFSSWFSYGKQSETVAMFHALSGSINILGDGKGKGSELRLRKLMLPNGKVLKGDTPLVLCRDSALVDPIEEKHIYKAYTFKGRYGVLGAFNLSARKRAIPGFISPHDIPNLQGEHFALFSFRHGFIGTIGKEDSYPIKLKIDQSDIFTFAPIEKGVAVIGSYQFYLAPGPVIDTAVDDDLIHIHLLVAVPLIIYCERLVLEVRRNGCVVPWEYDSRKKILLIDERTKILDESSHYTVSFE